MKTSARWLAITASLAAAGLLGWRLLDLYQGPWAAYLRPTRDFLQAAAGSDSIRLARSGASDAAIGRALETRAQHPEQLAVGPLRVISGQQSGDIVRVKVYYPLCADNILIVTFRGKGSGARGEDITLPCTPP